EAPNVPALPATAITHVGEKTLCWTYKDGKAVRTEIRTGISDGDWVEVTNFQRTTASRTENPWRHTDGSEQVILGDLSVLADGAPVEVTQTPEAEKVAEKPAAEGPPASGPKKDVARLSQPRTGH